MAGIRSSKQDYMYALEGVSYAQAIIKNHEKSLNELLAEFNNPEFMGGETGAMYCNKLQEAVSVVESIVVKFEKFAEAVQAKCNANGAFLEGTVMDDFAEIQKRFAHKASEIKEGRISTK